MAGAAESPVHVPSGRLVLLPGVGDNRDHKQQPSITRRQTQVFGYRPQAGKKVGLDVGLRTSV